MHYDYVVTLKRDNARKTDLVSFLLLIFSFLAFSYFQLREGFNVFRSIAILILLMGLSINIYASRRKKQLYFRNWLFATGLLWLGMPYFQWMFIPYVIFALLESQAAEVGAAYAPWLDMRLDSVLDGWALLAGHRR